MSIAQRLAPPLSLSGEQSSIRTSVLLDCWTVLMLATQIYGTFTPPETYFGAMGGIQNYPITPATLVIVSVTAGLMYVRLRARGPVMHSWATYAFVIAAFVSCTWSFDPQLSFQRALRLLPAVTLGVVYAQYYSMNHLLRLMIIGFLISALLSLAVGALVPSLGHSNIGNGYDNAWRGALIHKNQTGFLYALGVLMTIFAYTKRIIPLYLSASTFLTCLAMVFLAESATSVVSMFAALAVAMGVASLTKIPPTARVFALISFILLICIAAFISLLMPEIVMAMIGRDLSFTGRTEIWSAAVGKISEHPIRGIGYAYWSIDSLDRAKVWRAVGYTFAHAHNSWLDLWLQTGLVGLFSMSSVFIATFGRSWRLVARNVDRDALIFLTILIFLFIRSFTETEFCEPGITGVFWLVWASMVSRQMKARYG